MCARAASASGTSLPTTGRKVPFSRARKEPGVDVRLFGRCNGPECKRANRSTTRHQLTRIDGDLATIADHNHAAIIGQKLRVVGEIYVGEHFQNNVHAASVRRLQNFFLISGFVVIEDLIRTLSPGYFRTFGVPAVPKTFRPMARAI